MRILNAFSLALLAGLLFSSPAMAQQGSSDADSRLLTSDAMSAAVVGHESAVDQHRARLTELLATPRVRELAGDRGIDMERVESMAETLSDRDMVRLAPVVASATEAMQDGRATITISAVGLIILLLILILVT